MRHDLVSLSANLRWIDDVWEAYERDPDSLDPSWRAVFDGAVPESLPGPAPQPVGGGPSVAAPSGGDVFPLLDAFRTRGHRTARLDPLEMLERLASPELDAAAARFEGADPSRLVDTREVGGLGDEASAAALVEHLRRVYGGAIGLEFMHISMPRKRQWLAEKMEMRLRPGDPDDATRVRMLEQLIGAEGFERFIHTKFPGTKRFSLEGGESLIPLLEQVLDHAGRLGAIEAVIGMAHRGRLNVLTQTVGRAARDLFSEFEDIEPEATLGGGDVKYHLGYSSDRVDADGNHLHISLAFNPSHLEAVDPVVCGRVRAKQRRHADWERRQIVGIQLHGDAAFAGQGLVSETLQLSNLSGYRTGGTVHIVVNNQIGFTASPDESRSTPYCTDVAQMIGCPIWHVNGEDLDAVARTVSMAMEYRTTFQSDVVIDMFCYRKFGHNEMDEPSFTQPLMYARIQAKKSIATMYAEELVRRGITTAAEVEAVSKRFETDYQAELDAGRAADRRPVIPTMEGLWSPYVGGDDLACDEVDTNVSPERLAAIAERLTTAPDGFALHRKIERLFSTRREMASGERRIDWGMGELLAYGSLLWEGTYVRLSGQDSSRGTFSHRHALVTDINNGREHAMLNHLHAEQGECRIYDSPISEAGVLGFEFGYSLDYPDALVIWEAQFGDFANGAQVIIDQFVTTCEDKWNRLSGLVMYLPHGYEGQGPEHSSARIERFLQSCAEDCMQVVQPTTPAQIFHLLRRQVLRPYRKPLMVFTPKSLLRRPAASSTIDELVSGEFERIINDDEVEADEVERVFLCSGRIYFDLVEEREHRADWTTALVRIEQLYPLSSDALAKALRRFTGATEWVWVQDEPANMGPREFMLPRLASVADGRRVRSVSREASASPATGSHRAHVIEHGRIMNEAFHPAGSAGSSEGNQ